MGQIIAWKCDTTGTIFEVEKEYKSHCRKLIREKKEAELADIKEKERVSIFTYMRNTVRNVPELVQFIKDNWDSFDLNAHKHNHWVKKIKKGVTLDWIEIDLKWNDHISNSHHAPIGKKTNWGGMDENEPRNYPGWHGNIKYLTSEHSTGTYEHGSDMWEGTGIHPGTGGYTSNYYYDLKLFAADWPAMLDMQEQNKVFNFLKNEPEVMHHVR